MADFATMILHLSGSIPARRISPESKGGTFRSETMTETPSSVSIRALSLGLTTRPFIQDPVSVKVPSPHQRTTPRIETTRAELGWLRRLVSRLENEELTWPNER